MSTVREGVLVLAHGSSNAYWVQCIEDMVASIETDLPITAGYLEQVEGKSIADGVRELEAKGITRIITIPLFICSGSTHLDEIQYALGVKAYSRIETDLALIHPSAEIIWCSAMDAHPYTLSILTERIQACSSSPSEETLLLIAHGSNQSGFQEEWEKMLEQMSTHITSKFTFRAVTYATLLPDNTSKAVNELIPKGRLLVVPVFLSEGYFTKQLIPRKISQVPCIYEGQTYLPHTLIGKWIEEQIKLNSLTSKSTVIMG